MLRGIELPDIETKSKSIGNSQILPPELRNTEDAKIIAHRLLQKAASRLRRLNYSCKGLVLNISTIDNKHYRETVKFNMLSDSISLADKMFEAWNCLTYQNKIKLIKKISVTLINIDFRQQEFKQKSLFDDSTDDYINQRKSRERLSKTIDELNIKYGKDSVCIGVLPIESKKYHTGTKIAFGTVPISQDFNE